jgi:hypothetical protein
MEKKMPKERELLVLKKKDSSGGPISSSKNS